jgi:hypothetical protein
MSPNWFGDDVGTDTLPEWLPPAVAFEAQRLNHPTALRLATDERMKPVWSELRKQTKARKTPLQQIKKWPTEWQDLPFGFGNFEARVVACYFLVCEFTEQEAALLLFFCHAYFYTVIDTDTLTVPEADEKIAAYKEHAKQIRRAIVSINHLAVIDQTPLPAKYANHGRAVQKIASSMEVAAQLFDALAMDVSERKTADTNFPLVERRRKNQHQERARHYVRHLAIVTRKLFCGAPLYGTLATVASVALMQDIAKDQVVDWTQKLS